MFSAIKKLLSRYSATLCMQMHLFKITKYLHITFVHISVYLIFLKILLSSNLKSKIKIPFTLWSFWQIHNYNEKSDSKLKFLLCTKPKRNLFFRFKLSSLVTRNNGWFKFLFYFFSLFDTVFYFEKLWIRK